MGEREAAPHGRGSGAPGHRHQPPVRDERSSSLRRGQVGSEAAADTGAAAAAATLPVLLPVLLLLPVMTPVRLLLPCRRLPEGADRGSGHAALGEKQAGIG